MTLIELRAIVCEAGPVTSADDWWALASGIAEGAVQANVAWMLRRTLHELDVDRLGLRYRARPALEVGDGLGQGIRLAPAVIHDREGSCVDLACYCAALSRLHGRRDARVEFRIEAQTQRGHAVVVAHEFEFDPMIHLWSAKEV